MLFNSIEFLLFLPTVFVLYWLVFKNQLRAQNVLLLVASYVFYGWWDWRFLSLIIASTFLDYFIALQIGRTDISKKRKLLLGISLLGNLGMLGFFKYYNFFITSWIEAWSSLGITMEASTLNIILPVGISFYTFQTLSYTIDVYRKEMQPTKNFIDFATFVTFFPQLVAGPIERASHLLPQFYKNRTFDSNLAISGVQLILWGLFKKVVIADSCAVYVNQIFQNHEQLDSITLLMGSFYFAFQIYCDFSGYSDMAIGISRLFGFDLMQNFNYPYFSRDIAEFWRRWHISLSTWFRDYLYIPLGGSKGGMWVKVRNTFIIFLVSGFWHGANWTFIVWGLLNALYFLPLLLKDKNRVNLGEVKLKFDLLSFRTILNIVFTFLLTCLAWIFFRADTIEIAFNYLFNIFSFSFDKSFVNYLSKTTIVIFSFFLFLEWKNRNNENPLAGKFWFVKTILVIVFLILFGNFYNVNEFIYFQF